MTIPKRQFIGDHPIVKSRIELALEKNMAELEATVTNFLKPKNKLSNH